MSAYGEAYAVRGGGGAADRNTVGSLLARVRRYWVLVLAVTAVAVLASLVATASTPTTYVGRTSLIVSSNNRSPDQDAVLVQGYVVYFDNSGYQRQLLTSAQVPGDVSVSAQSAAASPILVISATTSDRDTAQTDAIQVAKAFMDDINRVRGDSHAQELVALQNQLDTALGSNAPAAAAVISDLQSRIGQIQADQVNVLQQLQAQGGVSAQRPSLFANLLAAVVVGLFLGVVGAVVLGGMSQRLRNGRDVADKVGLRTLVELSRSQSRPGRPGKAEKLGYLANIARARLTRPGVVAVAQPEEGSAASLVARELAHEWARQGHRTVLVDTGAEGVLARGEAAALLMRPGSLPGLSLLELAPRAAGDAPLSVSAASELLQHEALAGQYVVIVAPAVVRSNVAQAICQLADQTILVIDTEITRVRGAREAMAVLRKVRAAVMGAVVTSMGKDEDEDATRDAPADPTSSEAGRPSSDQRPAGSFDHQPPDLPQPDELSPTEETPSGLPGQDAQSGRG